MENNLLLEIVYAAIKDEFDPKIYIKKDFLLKEHKLLNKVEASFVTLKLNNRLRGCIGSLEAHKILLEDLIHNAKAAAFRDPRFAPLTKEEFENIHIEISLLSSSLEVKYSNVDDLKSKIKINTHGVILKHGNNSATFLPQVWEQLNSFELFFDALCKKAGLSYSCLEENPRIFTYEVKKIQ